MGYFDEIIEQVNGEEKAEGKPEDKKQPEEKKDSMHNYSKDWEEKYGGKK